MITADALKGLFESMGLRVVDITPLSEAEQRSRAAMAPMTDDELKAMWDDLAAIDGHPVLDCDDIHAELNRRGLGLYCAV